MKIGGSSHAAGDSSYRAFELPRVKLQQMYERNPREIDVGSSQ